MDVRRQLKDLVLLNDNPVFSNDLRQAFETLRRTDACAQFLWRGLYDDIGPSWYLTNLSIKSVSELPEVLNADTPPSFSWFLSLPSLFDIDKSVLAEHVMVYVACMQKPGEKDKVYTGSSFSLYQGSTKRVSDYQNARESTLSKYVREALQSGYKIVHMGALFFISLAFELRTPHGHSGVHGLEAWATYAFWTIRRGEGRHSVGQGHYLRHICRWDIDDLPYDGLCGHSPLMDGLTNGPPGMYEGRDVMLRLLEERIHARRAESMRYTDLHRVAQCIAEGYARSEIDDIVRDADESLLAIIQLGEILNHKKRLFFASEGYARTQDNRNAALREGRKLIKQVDQGLLLWKEEDNVVDADATGTDNAVVASDGQRVAIEKASRAKLSDQKISGKRKEGRRLLNEVKAGRLVLNYTDRPVNSKTGESVDVPVATEEQILYMEMARKQLANNAKHQRLKYQKKAAAGKENVVPADIDVVSDDEMLDNFQD